MNPPRFAFELDFLELTDHVPRTLGDSRMPCDMKWPPGPLLFFKQWMDEERCLEVSHLFGHGKRLASHGFVYSPEECTGSVKKLGAARIDSKRCHKRSQADPLYSPVAASAASLKSRGHRL